MSRIYKVIKIQIILFILLLIGIVVFSQETRQLAVDKPFSVADLKTTDGAALLNAKWFVQPAHIVNTTFKQPGPGTNGDQLKLYPTGAAIQSNQLHPQIGAVDFENGFKPIAVTELESRQGTGLFSFVWYKTELTIPESIGKTSTKDMTAVFEITVDDYSEIWVNGKQQQSFG